MTAMSDMSSAAINARLIELTEAQAAHDGRDLDAELAAAMQAGADVDALEEEHLEAERAARRLRVERQALEAALPAALVAQAEQDLKPLKKKHATAIKDATTAARKANDAWLNLLEAVKEFSHARQTAQEAVTVERTTLTKAGAADTFTDRLGVPTSQHMEAIGGHMLQMAPQVAELGRIHLGMVNAGLQQHRIEIEE